MAETQLTTEQLQRRVYQGICDQRLREFYETEQGLDYLMARLNLLKMVPTPAVSNEPPTQ